MAAAIIPENVAFHRCKNYDRAEIALVVDKILGTLQYSGSLHGTSVLLKPNLISTKAVPVACTHGTFIAGVAQWFMEQGTKVSIGDSPAFGSAGRVCEKLGIREALKGLDVEFVEFITPVARTLPCGIIVTLAQESFECDLLVGLPKLKAHDQMFVTLAMKNLFGVVKGTNKAMLHMKEGQSHEHFARIILELSALYPKQLHLIDGIEVMHKSGPLDGEVLPLQLVGGSISPVALDTALLDLLQLDHKKCPLWRVAAAAGVAGSDPASIQYPLSEPSEFYGSGFVAPESLKNIRFNPLHVIAGIFKRLFYRSGR